ncbi:Putative white-brown complex homolog protein 30 [Seminavis robusta]|uniref:White-brown complex homolog protein 30 n=1 Tax=Seminavis robusta TaxID=568900 RepID=A0A9N8EV49_9STRA|nr:Putative white-brown complex homolog protein 30 [Seminavis robusta]|eukprot:Sro2078_g313670.1 Putative white-brown complex homolog protein 30 (747) ;mRNA; r:9841-12393
MVAMTRRYLLTAALCWFVPTTTAWPRWKNLHLVPMAPDRNTTLEEVSDPMEQCFVELEFRAPEFNDHKTNHRTFEENEAVNLKVALGFIATALIAIGVSASTVKPKRLQKNVQFDSTKGTDVIDDGFDSARRTMESADLAFDGVKLTLTQKAKKNKDGSEQPATRLLLDGSLRGRARPGRMLAVMGPSGAGKSVFLHALAGRIKADKKLSLRGDRFLNLTLQPPSSILPAAFVEQEVNFFPRMTVRETVDFRVALHFGDLLGKASRDALVQDLLCQLGLLVAADTIVGDAKVRGISSGERKRLSIAVEMISSPGLVCCDEPTSSLDSAAAAVVIEKLRQLADQGKTVICVIHQPSSAIFGQFDDLLLISEGKQMYFGRTNKAKAYMEAQGYTANEDSGTAEHILECISPLPRQGESAEDAKQRLKNLGEAAVYQAEDLDLGIDHTDFMSTSNCSTKDCGTIGPRTSLWTQFCLLLHRASAETVRGKDVIFIKTVQQVVVASIYGGIYTLGDNQASILDRFGLLSLTAIGGTNMAIATTLRAFPKEKTIASAEIAIKQYRALPYFVAKAISEFPLVFFYNGVMGAILYFATGMNPGRFWTFIGLLTLHSLASEASGMAVGAVSPSSDVALAIFPAILILFVIFDGRNISTENTPWVLRWVSKISLIRWGFESFCLNEFQGLHFEASDASNGPVARTGEEALAMIGLKDSSIEGVVRAEVIITIVCWCLAYLGLTLTKQRFVVMEPKT